MQFNKALKNKIKKHKKLTWEVLASSRLKLKEGLKGLPDPTPYPTAALQFIKFLYLAPSVLPSNRATSTS
jgi:hypothetical protein